MLTKIWTITWKELYTTFTDRNLILIMLLTPLALATIIGAAFSGFINTSNDVPVQDIPVAVVNLDQGTDANGTSFNNGATFVNLLVPKNGKPDPANALQKLTKAEQVADAAAARSGVDNGKYAAAIIIPADFSAKLTYSQTHAIEPVAVEVYASPATPTSGSIIRSISESIVNGIATGNITVQATIETLIERAKSDPAFGLAFAAASASGEFKPDFAPAFSGSSNPLSIQQQTVTGQAATFSPLVVFGSAQAIFFMLFTAMGSATSLLEEKRDGTLQRLIASPTPRMVILLGKLIGTLLVCVAQVAILILALTIVGSILSGQIQFIWGSNLPGLGLVIVAVALAAAGLGTVVAALVRTPEQGNVIGGVISLVMGVFGGAFFNTAIFPDFLKSLSHLTITYWGTDAFTRLAQNQTDIGQNLAVLFVMGIVLFVAGLTIFNRRLSV
ncbi:MAG: ABC transporter permease subunit [Chloroflexi bacterium]|nr:ABC transporter permease subunit [Chloroflexota bacterium]